MAKILVLACAECDYVFENESMSSCPRCLSRNTEIIDVGEDE